ncbi:glycosyltransferase family 4 protein [Methylosinus sp. Sm6]|uniref:glycosyltransferase family 4 protein n=1 Tax=Methylosinus sp. Sm6 TaxID=2866948 RepID=UPI001C99B2F8|nr:glycosyltransferase family 4 protein [Methylosinus sp. Sm6]MBY6241983.1 glycosyltransferase family 4 protein [Methylosinus sp. Sm6]
MRIVHIVRQFWPSRGGLEEFVHRLARAQVEAGAHVRVVTLDRLFTDRDTPLADKDALDGIEIRRVPFFGSTRYPIAPGVLAHIGDADILHVHAVDFLFDFVALASLLRRRPIIATTHGGFFHTAAHSTLKRIWFAAVTRFTARRYHAIVACSDSDYRLFATISPNNLQLVENGTDIDKFAHASSRTPVKSLIAIGRFSVNKRLDRLLDAMRALVERDAQWRLDIVGLESDWNKDRLNDEIAQRSLQAHVQLHVGLDDDGVAQLIGRSSLFVSASEYEGFGIALIEALSAGLLPVVHGNDAYRAFSSRRGLIHIADFADVAATAKAIGRAFDELEASAGALRERAVGLAREFAWPRVAESYSQIYHGAAGSRRMPEIGTDADRRRDCSIEVEGSASVSKRPAERSRH